jgi:hypothetical protein
MTRMALRVAAATVAVSGVALGVALHGPAVAGEGLPASLQACRSEQDDARRLSCYDREMDQLTANPARSFGLSERQAQAARKDASSAPRPVERVTATITSMQQRPYAGFVITLDNGQVWRQVSPDGEPRIKVGDPVTIEPALLGSFLLTTRGLNWSTKVHRVR